MRIKRNPLVQNALFEALKLRKHLNRELCVPLCIYDFAQECGLEVRFVALSSVEGMYSKHPGPAILIGSQRPSGRQAFTCAHELGHHVFDHGTKIDDLLDSTCPNDPDEFLVQVFAGFLLMPKVAIEHAFSARGWDPLRATPLQYYAISNLFGVGYSTLIQHLCLSLRLISQAKAESLQEFTPQILREATLGKTPANELIIADQFWIDRPIDLRCTKFQFNGDYLIVPRHSTVELRGSEHVGTCSVGEIFRPSEPGLGRVTCPRHNWSQIIRVSAMHFEGLSQFRHLEIE